MWKIGSRISLRCADDRAPFRILITLLRRCPVAAPNARLTPLGLRVLQRYRGSGLKTRGFLRARWAWTPYEQIAAILPSSGTILDLGSGHGLLSLTMALSKPERFICGIDHDARRVEMSQQAANALPNAQFVVGDMLKAVAKQRLVGSLAGIVVMDAMHYLSFEDQETFLQNAIAALRPGGVLLVRDIDAGAGKTFWINRLFERMMVGLGFTCADRLHFRNREEWHDLFVRNGFEASSEPCSRFPFADRLFICKPKRFAQRLAA